MIKHTGGCYCKNITYSIEYDPMLVFTCHCVACKRASGESMSTAATFYESEVQFSGDMKIFKYQGGSGKPIYKYFCDNCGVRLMTKVDPIEGFVYLPVGTFDDWNAFRPKVELWNEFKSNWLGEFDCVSTIFEDNGTLDRIQMCLENLDQRE